MRRASFGSARYGLFPRRGPWSSPHDSQLASGHRCADGIFRTGLCHCQAQVKPFKSGSGVAPEGLPLPGQEPREHNIVGDALGRYTGTDKVQTDSAAFNPDMGTIEGEFGGGCAYTFVAANGDKLVCWYGRTDHGAAVPKRSS